MPINLIKFIIINLLIFYNMCKNFTDIIENEGNQQ